MILIVKKKTPHILLRVSIGFQLNTHTHEHHMSLGSVAIPTRVTNFRAPRNAALGVERTWAADAAPPLHLEASVRAPHGLTRTAEALERSAIPPVPLSHEFRRDTASHRTVAASDTAMSDVGANPFSDPRLRDPFQDPSVALASQTSAPVLEESNPFTEAKLPPKMAGPSINTQPAIMKPTEEPPAYSQHHPQEPLRAAAELLRRQDELERKAAELDRREREMRSLSASGGRKKNWPPLPEKFPIGPCFYNDTTVDIPVEFQKTVKLMYYLWMFHSWALFTNVLGCLAWFYVDPSRGMDFGLAIIWFMLFTPFSFVCWYRPLYGAFRSGSSFRFFVFFFVYICQFGIYVLQSIGIAGWGASGWISALMGLNQNVPVGVFMIVIAALFSSLAVLSLIMYKRVHGMYRSTGASFAKAQQELASSVMANKTVQAAVASAASRPSRGTFKEQI